MSPVRGVGASRLTRVALTLAVVWGSMLVVAALTLGSPTLVQVNGPLVLVPVGFSFKSGGDVRVFLESGVAIGFNQYATDVPKTSQSSIYVGGYGAVGILLTVR